MGKGAIDSYVKEILGMYSAELSFIFLFSNLLIFIFGENEPSPSSYTRATDIRHLQTYQDLPRVKGDLERVHMTLHSCPL